MATDEKLPRGSYRLETLRSVLADKLEHEPQILDVLVAATAKGQGDPALFELLHAAAQRDERIAELAFAYERLGQDRRMKTVPAAAQSEIFFHAARFFGDVFGDTDGAVTYLERVLALAPGHEGAFARLENILSAKDDRLRLRDLYASAAAHRSDVGEQVRLLRCALVLTGESDAERTIVLLEQIYKTDPTAEGIRDTLAQRLALAGRHGEAAKLIEQTLAAAAGEPPEATSRMRRRLVDLYAAKMHEAERAISHVEELLRADPEDALAKKCAEELLSHKVLGVRAAGALEGVYLHEARWIDAAGMMKLQAEQQRGPKRLEAQKRLAALTFERLGDLAKALSLYEAIVLADPADDDARDHFRKLSAALDKFGDAARILARVATAVREPKVKGRILAELGDVYAAQGDDKRARSTLFAALETGEDGDAMLGAAITLTNLLSVARDFRGLVVVLARLAELEPSATARLAAAERLAKVWEADLGDPKAAALAWRKLLGTKREATALAALERLYELTEDHPALAEILEKRAENEKSPAERRRLLLAAADRRALSPEGRGAALAAYANLATAYGASRELVERALPLLEQERRYAEVGVALEELARLVPTAEKAGVFARLAQVELARLRQPERAFAAYKQALALDPTERASRLAIEKLLASPSPPVAVAQRLAAADVLEPLYRKEAANAALARLLEVRGEIAEPVAARLAALAEATTLSANAGDGKRALELAGKGLRGAATQRVEDVRAWIARVDALSQVDAAKRGASLAAALEGVTVTRPELFELAKRAGETLAEAGDVGRALGAFRLALAFDPASPELVARVDGLLREQGSPAERVALFRAALDEPAGRGPRAALHRSIATIEHRELGDLGAAITSYRAALAEEPGDRASFEGLCEAHEARGAWSELYDELGRGLERAGGDERPPLVLRLAELAVLCGSPEQASGHYRELLRGETPVAEPVLAAIEKLATTYGDTDLLEQVIERRIALAIEPLEEIAWLERLGTLKLELRKRPKEAGRAWKRAAALAEGASTEPERAARLYEKVLTTTPEDPEAATRLAELYRAANAWERLPRVYELVLAGPLPAEERARWVLAWGEVAARTGGLDAFVDATDRALAEEPSAPLRRRLLVGRARALATLPTRRAEAASTYRGLLETGDAEAEAIARSFEELLAKHEGRDLDADRRWLFAYRVERASETEKPRLLHTWAEAEAGPMGDPTAAAELYARALDADPEDERALLALVRLRLAQGDGEGAALAIQSRRSGRDGVRGALDAELGALLVAAGRPSDALDAVRPALESAPVAEAVLAVLASIIAHPGSTAELLGALETLAARAPALEARRAVFDGLLGTRPEGSTKERRAGWYAGLFDACREEPEAALAVVLRAVAETPSDLGLWDRAEAIAAELHRPEAVSAAYRDVVREGGADLPLEILATLGRRAVEHLEEWFDDEDAVRSILRRVATGLGDVGWAFERLKLEYASREEYGALLDLYDAVLARQTDPDVALALVEEAAFAARDFAADPARAIGYFEALLPHPTRRAAALPALERLYERTGEHKKLALLFAEELRRLEGTRGAAPEDAARLRVRMATLWLDGADAKMALEVLAPLFGAEGASPAALAVAERVLDSGAEAVHRRTAAALLEACYRTTGRSRDLVRVLEATAGLIADPTEKDRLLREVLALRLGPLQDAAGGLETLATLLLLDPSDAHIRAELTALAERLGRAGRLVDALVAAAERATARATAEGLLDEAALLCEARLGDLDRLEGVASRKLAVAGPEATLSLGARVAESAAAERKAPVLARVASVLRAQHANAALTGLARALDVDAACNVAQRGIHALAEEARARGEHELFARAVHTLAGALTRADDAAALSALCPLRLDAAESDGERAALLGATAKLHERLGDALSAHDALLRAVHFTPSDAALAKELLRLTRATRRVGALAGAIAALDQAGLPRDVARELYREVGLYQRDTLGDDRAAEVSFLRARAIDPKNLKVLFALSEVQRKHPDGALVDTLLALSEVAGGDLEWLREATTIALDPVGDRALAGSVAERLLSVAEAQWGGELPLEISTTNARLDEGWSSKLSPAEAAAWAIDTLAQLRKDERDEGAVAALHLRAAAMPFDAREKRRRRLLAAGLSDAEKAIALYLELFLEEPDDPLVRSRLEALYRKLGRRGDLIALRELELARAKDAAARTSLRLDLAELFTEEGLVPRAEALLRETRAEAPDDSASFDRLVALVSAAGRFDEAVSLLAEEAERRASAQDRPGAEGLLVRAAELAEAKLDASRAIALHRRAAALGRERSLGELSRLLVKVGDHAGAAEVLEQLAESAPKEAQSGRAVTVADAWLAAGARDRAIACLEKASGAGDAEVRRRLVALHREDGNVARVAELLVEEAGATPERSARAARLGEAGRLYVEQLADPERGAAALEQAVALAPDDVDLVLALGRALRETGRVADAERSLRSIVTSFGSRKPKERALLHHELAQVALADGRTKQALSELDAALRIDPANSEILVSLARLAEAEGDLERAARAFRSLLLVARRPGARGDGPTRGEVLLSLARIAAQRLEPDRARELTESAFEAARGDAVERRRLLTVLRQEGHIELHTRALEMAIDGAETEAEAAALWRELGALRANDATRPDAAFDATTRALYLDAGSAEAHALAERLAEGPLGLDRYAELLARLDADPKNEAQRAALLTRAARLEARRGRHALAAARAQEAEARLAAEPEGPARDDALLALYRFLEGLYRSQNDDAAREKILVRRAQLTDDTRRSAEERADARYDLAELVLSDATRHDEGAGLLEAAFELAPDVARARAALERGLAVHAQSLPALDLLGRIARSSGDAATLVRAKVALADADPSRSDELREAFELAKDAGETNLAASILERVLTREPGATWASVALAELREAAADLEGAVSALERGAHHTSAEEADLLIDRAALLARDGLADPARAARLLEGIAARTPESPERGRMLAALYRTLGEHERLATLLTRTRPALGDDDFDAVTLELAETELRLAAADPARKSRAKLLLAELLDATPGHHAARQRLAAILESEGDVVALATLYQRGLDAAKDAEDGPRVVALSAQLGALLEQRGDVDEALDVYHGALAWQQNARDPLRAILRISIARDDSLDLGDALSRLLEVEEGREAEELSLKLAAIRGSHGDDAGAEAALQRGLVACPESLAVRNELSRRLSARGAFPELATLLEKALAATPKDRALVDALVEACEKSGDRKRGLQALTTALAAFPDDASLLARRGALHMTLGRDEEALHDLGAARSAGATVTAPLLEVLSRLLGRGGLAPARERDLRRRLAELELEAGELDRARGTLAELLRRDARDRDVLRSLAKLEERAGRWDAASATYRRLLALEDGEALVDTALCLATACERGGRLADARGALERAARAAPADREVRERLRAVYLATGASRELAGLVLDDARAAAEPGARFGLLCEGARLLIEAREDPGRAVIALEEAIRLKSNDLAASILLSDAYALEGRLPDAIAVLSRVVEGQRGRRSRALSLVHHRIGRIQLEQGDLSDALRSLVIAFDCDPQNAELAMELGLSAIDLDDTEVATRAFRAITLMRQPVTAAGAPVSKAIAYYHLASVARAQGDARKAVLLADKALAEDPELAEARILKNLLAP